ncbi:YggT family protein [Corynebacterium otitidis]|uniref:YggT family protein n=1 Tax=Corynebacterium otitidis ATCC 51513 TaxID=883169 RepID=I7JVK9_9CORY|nr:YggT family protein [Corynebacterium otitidis]EJZ82847.1 hypothetical protein HMPREF9719_00249 [Corynebacterium otitidis ATCC 51513]KKO83628.1 membrane protein [Corynebacterium otitidis]CCI83016.1 YggT family protein [Corynebacterium otitidis ATCC 51513]
MSVIGEVLLIVLRVYTLLLIARIIFEMIFSFGRNPRPPRWVIVIAEPIFVVTDPPVRLLRRVIPPLNLGNVALDLSVLVLFFILQVLTLIVTAILI